ncbi:hypothetical protein [Lacipirellula limnantheis]|nr:hypothetical protein [Lacipirellula limnantheis]
MRRISLRQMLVIVTALTLLVGLLTWVARSVEADVQRINAGRERLRSSN